MGMHQIGTKLSEIWGTKVLGKNEKETRLNEMSVAKVVGNYVSGFR